MTDTPAPNPDFDRTREALKLKLPNANAMKEAAQKALIQDSDELRLNEEQKESIKQRFETLSTGVSVEVLIVEIEKFLNNLEKEYTSLIQAAKILAEPNVLTERDVDRELREWHGTPPPDATATAEDVEAKTTEAEEGSLESTIEGWRTTINEKITEFTENNDWMKSLGEMFTASSILQAIFKYIADSDIPVLSDKAKELLQVEELHQIQNETGKILEGLKITLSDPKKLKNDETSAKALWSAWRKWRNKENEEGTKENENGSYRDFLADITDGKPKGNVTIGELVQWAGIKEAERAAADFDAEIKKSKEAAEEQAEKIAQENSLAEIAAFAKDPKNNTLKGTEDFPEISVSGLAENVVTQKTEESDEALTKEQEDALKEQLLPKIANTIEELASTVIAEEVLYTKLGLDPEEDQVKAKIVSADEIELTNVGLDHEYTLEKQESGKWKIDGNDFNDEKLKEKIGELNVITNDDIVDGNKEDLVNKLGLEEWKSNLSFIAEGGKKTLRVYSSGNTSLNTGYVKIEALDTQHPGTLNISYKEEGKYADHADKKFKNVAEYIQNKFSE